MDSTPQRPKRVVFLGANAKTVRAVSERLATKGVEATGFPDVIALSSGMDSASDSILVLDTGILRQEQDVALLLDEIDRLCGGRPSLICLSDSGDIDLRLQALRAGAEGFFVRPLAVDELAARLLDLSGTADADDYRVLVVDDQPVAALFAAGVLQNAGMQTRIVDDALRVLEVLEEFRPDLVLMDLNMPGADGIELTTLIREHDELYDTPVVFLSSELDSSKQMDALRVGGNDFIPKPVHPDRLIEAVRQGVLSFRSMRGREYARYERDWITGLMSRSAILKRLDSSIAHDIEEGPGNGVLMIEIDVGDTETDLQEPIRVDSLMERLAAVLRVHLEGAECAARYSDTRFAILARRENEGALSELARTLRSELESVAERVPLGVRIGIGRFDPPADDALTMISRAEKACSLARKRSGDRVGVYRPLVPEGPAAERDALFVEMVEEALRSEAFHLMCQPIVPLWQTSGERYEITVRLKAPDGEYIPAFDFLPAARRRGLMPAIDRWVIRRALDRFKQEHEDHQGLEFFVHQTMETLGVDDWLPWLRDEIVKRDLIMQRPVLQFQLDDLSANTALAAIRFNELNKLAIETCLNIRDEDPQVFGLVAGLGISLVRLPPPTAESLDPARLTDFVQSLHELGAKVIASRIENPQTIARVYACGVDFIQGNFLQFPAHELGFDFSESALGDDEARNEIEIGNRE